MSILEVYTNQDQVAPSCTYNILRLRKPKGSTNCFLNLLFTPHLSPSSLLRPAPPLKTQIPLITAGVVHHAVTVTANVVGVLELGVVIVVAVPSLPVELVVLVIPAPPPPLPPRTELVVVVEDLLEEVREGECVRVRRLLEHELDVMPPPRPPRGLLPPRETGGEQHATTSAGSGRFESTCA